MKILCLNVGIKIDNNKQLIDFIKKSDYDIIALQEVTKAHENSAYKMYKVYNYLIKEFDNEYKFYDFAPVWGAKEIVKDNKSHRNFNGFVEQGTMLLSKYEILESYNEFYHLNYTKPGYDATFFKRDDHARSIERCIVDVNNKRIQIINVHGIWNKDKIGDERTYNQCQFIIEKAMSNNLPTIVLGDFNLLPETKEIKLFNNEFVDLVDKYKIKSTRPKFDDGLDKGNLVCDYIFVTRDIVIKDFKVLENDFSDHLPLELEFELKGE